MPCFCCCELAALSTPQVSRCCAAGFRPDELFSLSIPFCMVLTLRHGHSSPSWSATWPLPVKTDLRAFFGAINVSSVSSFSGQPAAVVCLTKQPLLAQLPLRPFSSLAADELGGASFASPGNGLSYSGPRPPPLASFTPPGMGSATLVHGRKKWCLLRLPPNGLSYSSPRHQGLLHQTTQWARLL